MPPKSQTEKSKKGELSQLVTIGLIAGLTLTLCWVIGVLIRGNTSNRHHHHWPTGLDPQDKPNETEDQLGGLTSVQDEPGDEWTWDFLLQEFCKHYTGIHQGVQARQDCVQITRQQVEQLRSEGHRAGGKVSNVHGNPSGGNSNSRSSTSGERVAAMPGQELSFLRPGRFSALRDELERILLENTLLESARFTDRSVTQLFGRIHPLSLGLSVDQRTRRPLDVIYQQQPFHWQWHIDQHLQKVQRPIRIILDPNSQRYQNNAIIAVNHLTFKHSDRYFTEQAKRGNTNIAALHQGDITISQSYGWYKKTKFVLRNHFPSRSVAVKKGMALDRMYVLPLGSPTHDSMSFVNRGEFGRVLPASKRKHLCNFIGSLLHHETRMALGKSLHAAEMGPDPSKAKYEKWGTDGGVKCFTYYSGEWKNKKQMQPWEYRAMISNSAFTFVPPGRGPSSFRLTEALELGSIPIISDIDNFNLPYGEHPLPTIKVSEWGTLPPVLVKMYSEHMEELDVLQERVFAWWHAWKQTY